MEHVIDKLHLGYINDTLGRANKDLVLNPEIKPYGFLLEGPETESSIKRYTDVFGNYQEQFIKECKERAGPHAVSFVVFSYLKPDGVQFTHKHVHPRLGRKPCFTKAFFKQLTFDFPEDSQYLYWHDNLGKDYKREIYSSYNLIESLDYNYEKIQVKCGSVLNFCSSNKIHFTNNTRNLGMWVVFDYVENNFNDLVNINVEP